jgi:hypothetical protein
MFNLACSSDSPPAAPKADAGKDTRAGSGGAVGTGGSTTTTGTGGSTTTTGTGGSTTTTGTGGSTTATGTGGSTSATGTGGSTSATGTGGSTSAVGTGGSTTADGTGGTTSSDGGGMPSDDGGSVDVGTSDSLDAPLLADDAASEAGASDDGGVPTLLDSGSLDVEVDSEGIDSPVILLDAEIDSEAVDVPVDAELPDAAADTAPDPFACSSISVMSGGATGNVGSTDGFCFVTCDDIAGWGVSNLDGRQIKVNKVAVAAGDMPLPASTGGTFYLFQVTAGTYSYASIYWWNGAGGAQATCPAPAGGFLP